MDVHVQERLHLKLERAERHIFDLSEAWASFLEEKPYPHKFEDDAVCVAPNQPNGANYDDHNDGHHDCILRDVLTFITEQSF